MATGNRTLKLSILADVDDLKKKLGDADKAVESNASKISEFGKKAAAAFAIAAAAAVAYAGKLAIDGVKSAIEDEQAQLRLANALKTATGATDAQIRATEEYISKTQIVVRILSRQKGEVIDAHFFKERIKRCWQYRQQTGYTENCRLVFGEADELPQLIIDKFNDYFVIQTLALGIDRWKPEIVDALQELFSPKGIYERNDVPVRELEGLPQQKGFLSAPFETKIIISENGLKFYVDLANGQKTGYFLDQQDNRTAIRSIVKNATVLGAFTYTGTFEVHAAHYGATSVLS